MPSGRSGGRAARCCASGPALVATVGLLLILPAAGASRQAAPQGNGLQGDERLEALYREADALANEAGSLLDELRRLEVERTLRTEELKQVEAQLAETTRELEETDDRIDTLQAAADAQRPALQRRLVELYKLGNARYVRLLLDAEDLRRLGRAYRLVSQLAELDRKRIEEHRRTLAGLREARAELEQERDALTELRSRARTARIEMDRAVAAQNTLIREIDRRRDLNAQLTGELLAAQAKLQASLTTMGAAAGPETEATLPLSPFQGELEWPVAGALALQFRQGETRNGTTIIKNGVEIGAAEGTAVRAVLDGRVAFAGVFAGFGNLVILEHGRNSFSLYGYLASLSVQKGGVVERGRVVGSVGRAPAGEPRLYFELRVDGVAVDPVQWLERPTNR